VARGFVADEGGDGEVRGEGELGGEVAQVALDAAAVGPVALVELEDAHGCESGATWLRTVGGAGELFYGWAAVDCLAGIIPGGEGVSFWGFKVEETGAAR
jgi:hypothetical protein